MDTLDRLTHETTELLQQLIRNGCVNDGTRESGEETRNADVLRAVLEGAGLEVETLGQVDGRDSVVARIDGSDPDAPTLMLMGHTDVVPAVGEDWREDPFGGELIDGEVWGRGALDMLCLTASMAVAVRHLADTGWTPRGSLVFLGVADEEAGGTHGAQWLVDEHWDAVECDYVLTELGGFVDDSAPAGVRIDVPVAEKGTSWRRITVRGTPGHGSAPWGSDNALVTASEVVRRLASHTTATHVDELWRAAIRSAGFPADLEEAMLDPGRIRDHLDELPDGWAAIAHACTHMTISPNVAHGGQKTNTIPDRVVLEVDIRTLPGQTRADVDAELRAALGDLYDRVQMEVIEERTASASPTDTPLYDLLTERLLTINPGAIVYPSLITGGTDASFFREKGVPSYGAGAFSDRTQVAEVMARFHGLDERIDVESLRLQTQLWLDVAAGMLD